MLAESAVPASALAAGMTPITDGCNVNSYPVDDAVSSVPLLRHRIALRNADMWQTTYDLSQGCVISCVFEFSAWVQRQVRMNNGFPFGHSAFRAIGLILSQARRIFCARARGLVRSPAQNSHSNFTLECQPLRVAVGIGFTPSPRKISYEADDESC